MDIPGADLALYDNPSSPTAWSRLMMTYNVDGWRVFAEDPPRFPSPKLAPGGVVIERKPADHDQQISLMVQALRFGENQLGFVVFDIGPRDIAIYGELRNGISSAWQGEFFVQEIQRNAGQLTQAMHQAVAASNVLRQTHDKLNNERAQLQTVLNSIGEGALHLRGSDVAYVNQALVVRGAQAAARTSSGVQ